MSRSSILSILQAGYKFLPTDVEICYYLRKKVLGQDIPHDVIVECNDVYNVQPWFLPGVSPVSKKDGMKQAAEVLYFFVPSQNGLRADPKAGNGFWKADSTNPKEIMDEHGKVIGLRKRLSYFRYADEKQSSEGGTKTEWVMHKFALFDIDAPNKFQEWTICRIMETGRLSSSGNTLPHTKMEEGALEISEMALPSSSSTT